MRFGPGSAESLGRLRAGFTLVELLVVITIIGILMSLLIPAVQSAREAGRATQCASNLRQWGLGALQHVDAVGFFPSDGWGHDWIGDPDRGFGVRQPGSWLYSVLPFIEQKNLWSLGSGIPSDSQLAAKEAAMTAQATTALAVYYCPTRRAATAYPYIPFSATSHPWNASLALFVQNGVGKSDYACNAGDSGLKMDQTGPSTLAAGDAAYSWFSQNPPLTGVSFQRSQITLGHLSVKGASNEYLFGEKYLDSDLANVDLGDNECAMAGFDDDNTRTAGNSTSTLPCTPLQDTFAHQDSLIFGSSHPSAFHMVFCDGSIHNISYSIDRVTHGILANRNARVAIDPTKVQ